MTSVFKTRPAPKFSRIDLRKSTEDTAHIIDYVPHKDQPHHDEKNTDYVYSFSHTDHAIRVHLDLTDFAYVVNCTYLPSHSDHIALARITNAAARLISSTSRDPLHHYCVPVWHHKGAENQMQFSIATIRQYQYSTRQWRVPLYVLDSALEAIQTYSNTSPKDEAAMNIARAAAKIAIWTLRVFFIPHAVEATNLANSRMSITSAPVKIRAAPWNIPPINSQINDPRMEGVGPSVEVGGAIKNNLDGSIKHIKMAAEDDFKDNPKAGDSELNSPFCINYAKSLVILLRTEEIPSDPSRASTRPSDTVLSRARQVGSHEKATCICSHTAKDPKFLPYLQYMLTHYAIAIITDPLIRGANTLSLEEREHIKTVRSALAIAWCDVGVTYPHIRLVLRAMIIQQIAIVNFYIAASTTEDGGYQDVTTSPFDVPAIHAFIEQVARMVEGSYRDFRGTKVENIPILAIDPKLLREILAMQHF